MEIPLFPLHAVLFPGAQMPIRIFEARYRALLEHVLRTDRSFGIAAIRLGMEVGGPAETYEIGTMASIEQMRRDPSDASDIVVNGGARFRIASRLPDDPFPSARVEVLDEQVGAHPPVADARAALRRYLSVVAQLHGADVVVPPLPESAVEASFSIAAALQLDLSDRQRLLACDDASTRLQTTSELAKREARLLEAVGPSVGRPPGHLSMN